MPEQRAFVNLSVADRIAHIELARPEFGNSLDLAMTHQLRGAVQGALDHPEVDIVKLTSTGDDFCVGTDTQAAREADDPTTEVFEQAAALDEMFAILNASTKPVVAAVQGLAAGSGLGMALAADVTLCSPQASFRVANDGGLGAPDPGLAWLLPRAVGQQRALAFALGRQTLDAQTAERWGLVTIVEDDLGRAVHELACSLTGEHLWANGETRRLLRATWETNRTELAQSEAVTMVRAMLRARS